MNDGASKKRIWRKPVVALTGGVVVLAGVVMLVTPGPGLLAIAAGLAILATEFKWAERQLERVRDRIRRMAKKNSGSSSKE